MVRPSFTTPQPGRLMAALLTALTLLGTLALQQFGAQLVAEELMSTSANFRLFYQAGVWAVLALGVLTLLAWSRHATRLLSAFARVQAFVARLRLLAFPSLLALAAFYLWLVYGFYGRFLTNAYPRIVLFFAFALLLASLLAAWRRGSPWAQNLFIAALGLGLLHNASTFFIEVTNYPFSLGWSEISRYYQASFYFSQSVYGVELPLPVTHPSRYLLQSLPFLFGDLPIWLHRFWQAFLWMLMPALTAWALLRRLDIKDRLLAGLLGGWVFLYLMQGAVFYHLLPAVFIVLFTFDRQRLMRSFAFVALASLWAGISRINWAPMPGALAALLYLLDTPLGQRHPLNLRYWAQPALHFIGGGLVALGAYWLYIQNSGVEDISQFSSSFSSDLLWNRLWPNAAFAPGILVGTLLTSLVLFIIVARRLRQPGAGLGAWRTGAIALILLVFFGGGLVVSAKIGGGTNLHNMDAYMVLLLVLGLCLLFGRYAPQGGGTALQPLSLSPGLLALALVVPLYFSILLGGPLNLPEDDLVNRALQRIQFLVDEAEAENGQVLFISQRHLLTFHLIDGQLVHDYEKLFLMEMAISHNQEYLQTFEDDLSDKRFTYIVTDPLNLHIRDEELDPLSAENNEWVREVSSRVLCYYRELASYDALGIQILWPRYDDSCQ